MFCLNFITGFTCAQILVMVAALMVKVGEERVIFEGHVAVRSTMARNASHVRSSLYVRR
jgi:hypothetical protein